MSQEVVKKKAHPADVLTIMQRRFVDYLVYNQGRTTFTDAALAAGYSPNRARIEGSELMDNPKVIKYLRYKTNEVNRSYTVTKNNYVLRQQKLSKALEDAGKPEKSLGFENLIGKATGQFNQQEKHYGLKMKRLYPHMKQRSKQIWKFVCICMHALSFCCIRIYQILRLMHAPHPQLYQPTRSGKSNKSSSRS